MISSVLVVCVGNICRSPVGSALFSISCPSIRTASAGLAAVVGAPADPVMSTAASEVGIDLTPHVATQLTRRLATAYDLILVMENSHRSEIRRLYPEVSGRTMLLGHWIGAVEITDPYRKALDDHRNIRNQIVQAVHAWTKHIH